MATRRHSYVPPTKLKKKPILSIMATTSVKILFYTIIFSLFSFIFLLDKIPDWVRIIVGIVFEVPIILLVFSQGKTQGEIDYKLSHPKLSANIHESTAKPFNKWKCLLYPLFYGVVMLVLMLICILTKVKMLHGILVLFVMPIFLFFIGCNILAIESITWMSFLAMFVAVVSVYIPYVIGYLKEVYRLNKQQGDIATELRLFGA